MAFIIIYYIALFAQVQPPQPQIDWTNVITIVFMAAITTITGVVITQHLNKVAKINEDRFGRTEKNVEKIFEKLEEICDKQGEFNTHIHLQKEQNKYHTQAIEENKKNIGEVVKDIKDVLIKLLNK